MSYFCTQIAQNGKKTSTFRSDQHTKMADAQDLIKKGEENKEIEIVLRLNSKGLSHEKISDLTDLAIRKYGKSLKNKRL